MLLLSIVLTCPAQTPSADAARAYTNALLREASLEDELQSLRAIAGYSGQPAAWETYHREAQTLARIRAEMQVDEPRPNLEAMNLPAIEEQAGSALERVKAALGPRPAFSPLPVLSAEDRKDLMHRFAFGALVPSPQRQTPEILQLLRQLGVQFLDAPHGYYADDPKTSMATDPKLVLAHAARADAAGLGLMVWLQPDANIAKLWPEIGADMYLHDAQGRWQDSNRINNNINVFHPRVREEASAWLRQFAGAQHGDPRIIGYDLVEEPALRFDVSPADSAKVEPALGDYTEASKSAFHRALAQKYGRIEELNRLWNSHYSSFDAIEPPSELQRKTPWEPREVPLLVEFQEFRAVGHADYFRLTIDALHHANPGAPVLPKLAVHVFGDPLGGVDLSRMSEAGWDAFSFHTDTCFPCVYSLARYRNLPMWNGEYIWTASSTVRPFLTPRDEGEFKLRAHAAIALWHNLMWGARGFVLFNADFAWNHPKDGGDWNNELLNSHLGNRVPRYAAAVFPQILPKVRTFQHELLDSVIDNEGLYLLEPTTSIYASTPTGTPTYWATRVVDRLVRGSFHPVIVPERYIATGKEDLRGARVIMIPNAPYVPEAVFRKLRAWNAAGGTLITLGPFATHDAFGNARPDFTLDPGARHITIPAAGKVDALIAAVESAVRAAVSERPVATNGAPLEWMLRHVSATEDLLVVLNGDPHQEVSASLTLRRKYNRITDLTIEGGADAPAGKPIPAQLDPGEARVFLLQAGAPQRPYLAVVEKVAGSVGFYAEDGTQLARVGVGPFPHEAVLSRDGKLLYVSVNGVLWMTEDKPGNNTIAVVDTHAMHKVRDIDLGRFHRPHGIAWTAAGDHLLATTERPFGLILADPVSGKVIRDYDVKGKSPHMVMPSPDGEWAYVSDTDSDVVAAIRLKTGAVTLIQTGGRPQGGVFSPDARRLYVVNTNGNKISIIDTAPKKVIGEIPTGKGPGRIAITPDGKTLVYNLQFEPAIGFVDIASGKQTAQVALPSRPLSLTLSRDSRRAFLGIQDQDKVVIVSVAGKTIEKTLQLPKDSGPDTVVPLY